MKMKMIFAYSIVIAALLVWEHHVLKSFAICDTDANCEALSESWE